MWCASERPWYNCDMKTISPLVASASAANPAPLSVPKANGKPSGVHTNQALTATVKW